jgi:hypothetical protein
MLPSPVAALQFNAGGRSIMGDKDILNDLFDDTNTETNKLNSVQNVMTVVNKRLFAIAAGRQGVPGPPIDPAKPLQGIIALCNYAIDTANKIGGTLPPGDIANG